MVRPELLNHDRDRSVSANAMLRQQQGRESAIPEKVPLVSPSSQAVLLGRSRPGAALPQHFAGHLPDIERVGGGLMSLSLRRDVRR